MKPVVGLVEKVKIMGKKSVSSLAVFDTGATTTSVDIKLASKAGLGPVTRVTKVKNPSLRGKVSRPVVRAKIDIHGKTFRTEVNLQDRSHMKFPVIIGRNVLAGNFLVDPQKNMHLFKKGGKRV
jgi:hypothetical protein